MKEEPAVSFSDRADSFTGILKQAFIYFPAVFHLFFFTTAQFMFDFGIKTRLLGSLVMLICGFLTVFAIGDIKDPKHAAMPLSVVGLACLGMFAASVFGIPLAVIAEYQILLFPLALMLPFIVKGMISHSTEQEKKVNFFTTSEKKVDKY